MPIPSLSILIVRTNGEDRLPAVVKNLESQTFRDYEVIGSDGAAASLNRARKDRARAIPCFCRISAMGTEEIGKADGDAG